MAAYYNEIEPFAVAWLRELIKCGLIADGVVDDRPIEVVQPADLAGYTQCHFFAGIGVWSYALRSAGWPDDRPVWTGSCPCQPFSHAGNNEGGNDPRHLWPAWFRLIRKRRPGVVFGEQVEAAIRHGWLDAVSADVEGEGYAIGSAVFGAHSVGAPHRRQRLYFVADTAGERRAGIDALLRPEATGRIAAAPIPEAARCGPAGVLVHAERSGPQGLWSERELSEGSGEIEAVGCPVSGFWADAEWINCADGRSRPVEPGTFPLAHGAPARMGRLRGYGNAIVAPLAQAFIEAYLDVRGAA